MTIVAELNVTGLPATQGSHQAFIRGKRAIVVPVGAAKLEAWRGAVAGQARQWLSVNGYDESPWDRSTPLSVAIVFRLPEPKQRPQQLLHERRPDIDKLARAVLDALTRSGLIVDDSRIAILVAAKRWQHTDTPGAEIVVRAALDDDLEEVFTCWAS
jgi:Holliday junction resolvase RusA-like endonuclease